MLEMLENMDHQGDMDCLEEVEDKDQKESLDF